MPLNAPPPGFEETRSVTAEELKSLPSITHEAVHVLERCTATHHIAAIDYTDAEGDRTTIRLRPAFIRHSNAYHIVTWGIPDDGDHWVELRLDRIGGSRDTGDVFEPTW